MSPLVGGSGQCPGTQRIRHASPGGPFLREPSEGLVLGPVLFQGSTQSPALHEVGLYGAGKSHQALLSASCRRQESSARAMMALLPGPQPSVQPLFLLQGKVWISSSSLAFVEEASCSSSLWHCSLSTSARGKNSTEGEAVSSLLCPTTGPGKIPVETTRGDDTLSLARRRWRQVVSECQGCNWWLQFVPFCG